MRSAQEALDALRAAQPDAANASRDFGRGYAYAVAVLEEFLADDDDGPAVYINDDETEMVVVSEDRATVAVLRMGSHHARLSVLGVEHGEHVRVFGSLLGEA